MLNGIHQKLQNRFKKRRRRRNRPIIKKERKLNKELISNNKFIHYSISEHGTEFINILSKNLLVKVDLRLLIHDSEHFTPDIRYPHSEN